MDSVGDLSDMNPQPPQPVGIYGWRKRCVYTFLLILMVIVIINIALTVWILRVLQLSFDGIEGLKFSSEGLKLSRETEFAKPVYTNEIRSTNENSLYMMSNQDIQLVTTDGDSQINTRVALGSKSVEATCDTFTVQDSKGIVRMKIDGDDVMLGTKDASYPGDIEFGSSVSVPTIRSPLGQPLKLESATSKVHVIGRGGIQLTSDAGDVSLRAQHDVYLSSTDGYVHIQSPKVYMENLPVASKNPSRSAAAFPVPSSKNTDLYQLCACANGKLFTAPADETCSADLSVCSQI